jgi:hypothetical protein
MNSQINQSNMDCQHILQKVLAGKTKPVERRLDEM